MVSCSFVPNHSQLTSASIQCEAAAIDREENRRSSSVAIGWATRRRSAYGRGPRTARAALTIDRARGGEVQAGTLDTHTRPPRHVSYILHV